MKTLKICVVSAFLCSILMSIPILPTPTAQNVTVPMNLTLLQDFSGYTLGENVNVSGKVPISPSTATTAGAQITSTLGAPEASKSVTLSSTTVGGYSTSTNLFYEMFYPQNTMLNNLQGVMVYIRLPQGKPGDRYSLFNFNLYVAKNNQPFWINAGNSTFQYLGKNASDWETQTAFDSHMKLPYGFEGYVKLLFADLPSSQQQTLQNAQLKSSTFCFREIGGARGSAVVNAVYGVVTESNSNTAVLSPTNREVFLTTGMANDGSQDLSLDMASKAKVFQDFSGFSCGNNVKDSGMFTSTKSTVSATAVTGMSGLSQNPSLEISSPTLSGFRDTSPQYEVFFSQDTCMDGMETVLFYVKCGGPHPQDNSAKVFFSLYSTRGNEANYSNLGNGTAYYLPKNKDTWISVTATDGILTLPTGFEGYIKADISELKFDSIAERTDNRYAISMSFRFLALGGEAGSCYLDDILMLKQAGTNPFYITYDGCNVYDMAKREWISDPMQLMLLQDFSDYKPGQNIKGAGKVIINPSSSSATATAVQGQGVAGSVNAIVMNSADLGGFATSNNLMYEVFSPPNTYMNSLQGVMMYIKLPKGRPGDRYSMFSFTLYTIKNSVSTWTQCENAPVMILAQDSSSWETVNASSGNIRLPYGFEGYVKLRFADLSPDKQAALNGAQLVSTTYQFREIGADRGGAVLHAIYGIMQDGNAPVASIPGSGNMYLANSASTNTYSKDAQNAIHAKVMQTFSAFNVGDNVRASEMLVSTKTDVQANAIAGINGFRDKRALEITSPTLSGFQNDDVQYEVFYEDNTRMDGMAGILVYLRCPQPYPGESSVKMKVNIYSVRGSQANFTNLGSGTARYLSKGSYSWINVTASDGILWLPAGFEGYVMADFSQMNYDSIAGQTDGRIAVSSTFQFSALGGSSGSCIIDSIYGVGVTGTNPLLLTVDGVEAVDMSTGLPYTSSSTISVQRRYHTNTGDEDMLLLKNPQRGFRMETFVNVANLAADYQTIQDDPAIRLKECYAQYTPESPQLAQVYFYLTGYKNTPTIPAYGLNRIQAYFDYAREIHVQLLVRFAYQSDMNGTGEASQAIMLGHMQQLAPILNANKDIIHVVQAGFLGAWGEWHSYQLPHDRVQLLRGLDGMTPAGRAIQVRIPNYKNLIPATDSLYPRLSFHNDSVFGEAAGGTGGVDPGTAQWIQLKNESPYQPVDGELFWGSWSLDQGEGGFLIDGYKVIKQLSEHHFTSLSVHHNYREDGPSQKYSIQYWKENAVTENWLKTNNILFAPTWFRNHDGQPTNRNVFDFVRDYLGYKLDLRMATLSGTTTPGGVINAEVNLANYGFSVPFNMESGFAVLDAENQVISTISAGTPSNWHSRNPANYSQGTQLSYTVSASVVMPSTVGRYKLAFYVKDTAGNFARMGSHIPYLKGYTIIGDLVVR